MVKVNILSDMPRWKDHSILFYIYKWQRDFKNQGIDINIFYDHIKLQASSADVVIILSRYFSEWQNIQRRNNKNEANLIDYLNKIKKNYNRVFWYDISDGTGSTDFAVIDYVDGFLKNQVFKNRNYYTENHGRKSVRIWLQDTHPDVKTNFDFYQPCSTEALAKIKVAWNLGFCDYRYFPHYFRVLSNYLMGDQKLIAIDNIKNFDLSSRGASSYDKTNLISFQRNKVAIAVGKLNGKINRGDKVPRKQYLNEIQDSKICISPFGWGEICYRDFEAFLSGCLLVKPTVEYLDTFPNVYIPVITYIPVQLDMEDIESKLQYAIDNYTQFYEIAHNGQKEYLKYIKNSDKFISHFIDLISK